MMAQIAGLRKERRKEEPRDEQRRPQLVKRPHVLQHIVVPTDFTHVSDKALAYARALSRTYGSKVTALHAVDPFEYKFGPEELRTGNRDRVWSTAREAMEAWIRPASLTADSVLIEGDPITALAELDATRKADLVVLGTAGREHISRALFGSVAEEIFRAAHCPVLVLGPSQDAGRDDTRLSTLLFATDLEPHSLATLPAIISLAADLSSEIYVIRVVHPDIRSAAERYRIRKETEQRVEIAAGSEHSRYIKEVKVVFDDMVDAICKRAAEVTADAIVLGVRGDVQWDRAATHLPWARAHRVIVQAPCPVLTFRSRKRLTRTSKALTSPFRGWSIDA